MFKWLFGEKSVGWLGIDLGSSAIKVVELEKKEERFYLANYAVAQFKSESIFKVDELKEEEVADILKALISRAQLKGKVVSLSLPVDKTFSTLIDLPAMPEQELSAAISYEAHKYVPVPLEEVVLDWTMISPVGEEKTKAAPGDKNQSVEATAVPTTIQVLLVAVPKEIINRLTKIAKLAGLEVAALEQEAFSLARSLIGNDRSVYLMADLGRRSVDLIVVDGGFVKMSHNCESVGREVILMEIDRIVNIYQMRYNRKVEQCVLTGGRSREKELADFLSGKLKIPVRVGDPFARVNKNSLLDPVLQEIGPSLAVATGLAMRDN